MCDKNCHNEGCPFAFSEESEQIQNYGCLPTPYDIISMRVHHDKTWACHSNPKKPCRGAIEFLKERGFEHTVKDKNLLTEDSQWHLFCKVDEGLIKQIQEADMKRLQRIYG